MTVRAFAAILLMKGFETKKKQRNRSTFTDTLQLFTMLSFASRRLFHSSLSRKPPLRILAAHSESCVFQRSEEEEECYSRLPQPINIMQQRWFSATTNESKEHGSRAERFRERAGEMRENASERWHELREDPEKGARAFGAMMKKFGPVFIGTYLGVYVSTLALFFGGIETGVLDPVVLFQWIGSENGSVSATTTYELVIDFMKNHTVTKPAVPFLEKNPSLANFAVAWITVKFTEPVRLPLALFLTPRVARMVGYRPKEIVEEKTQQANGEEKTTATKDVVSEKVSSSSKQS